MALPTQITITGLIANADGPMAGKLVFASSTLVRDASSGEVLIPDEVVATVGADGLLTVVLSATNDPGFSPTGWTWEVRPHFDGWRTPFSVAIPYDSPGAALLLSQLVEVPPDGDADLYALVNHVHEGGGGGGGALPASTVVSSTTYGQTSTAGAATTYSRGDHRHGSVSLPTAADVGAATAAHVHTGVYDPVNTASGLVTTHAAAANPHPIYLTQAEADLLYAGIGGGGGGTAPTFARARVTSGDLTTTADAAFTLVSGLTMAIAAVNGDDVTFSFSGMLDMSNSGTEYFDVAVVVGGSAVQYASTGTATPAVEGDPTLYPGTSVRFRGTQYEWAFTVGSGDLSGGNVTFQFAHKGGGSAKVLASTSYPLRWSIRNDH